MTGNSKPKNKFGMLIKNDFLASSRVITLFYIFEIAAFIFFLAAKKIGNSKFEIIGVGLNFIIPFLLIFVSLFFVVYDFYKSLYTQQGYLSYSLPVTANQLLGAKMFVYGMWMFVSFAVSILVWGYLASYAEGNEKIGMADVLLTMFGLPSLAHIKIYVLYYILVFFVLVFSFVSIVYFAITAGHMRLLQKANILWAVIIFCIASLLMFIMVAVIEDRIFINFIIYDDGPVKFRVGNVSIDNGVALTVSPIFYMIIQDVVLFFATSHIMHKKVNIK